MTSKGPIPPPFSRRPKSTGSNQNPPRCIPRNGRAPQRKHNGDKYSHNIRFDTLLTQCPPRILRLLVRVCVCVCDNNQVVDVTTEPYVQRFSRRRERLRFNPLRLSQSKKYIMGASSGHRHLGSAFDGVSLSELECRIQPLDAVESPPPHTFPSSRCVDSSGHKTTTNAESHHHD